MGVLDLMTVGDALYLANDLILFGMGIVIGWASSYDKHRKIVAKLVYERIKGDDLDAVAKHANMMNANVQPIHMGHGGNGGSGGNFAIAIPPPPIESIKILPEYVENMSPRELHEWLKNNLR